MIQTREGSRKTLAEHAGSILSLNSPPLPQQVMSYTLPSPTYKNWLRAWREWARTRKRGKMAQFVVDKLEDNVSADW